MHLRDYQTQAVKAICQTFDTHDRAQLHAACGTGKTHIALWAAGQLAPAPATIAITVPTLALAAQVIDTWQRDGDIDAVLAVCSDQNLLDSAVHAADLAGTVTTDPGTIADWLAITPGRRLVVTTYISAPTLGAGLRLAEATVDLLICDEAHHLTGHPDGYTRQILDDACLPAAKRLFMTATPRINEAAAESGRGLSMSDTAVFGPVAATYSWARAIDDGWLEDYRVVVIGLDAADLRHRLADADRDWVTADGTARDLRVLAAQLACLKAAQQYQLRRVLVFANRVTTSKDFTRTLPLARTLLPEHERPGAPAAVHIDGTMTSSQREKGLAVLRHPPGAWTTLSNVRCLSEGIDIPAVDAVAFTHPKQSLVETVQCIGRALRRGADQPGVATIVVPIVLPATVDTADIGDLDPREWAVVWEVVNALRELDEDLAVDLDLKRRADRDTPLRLPERISVQLPEDTDERLAEHLRLLILKKTTSSWWEGYNCAAEFAAEHGHLDLPVKYVHSGFNLGIWVKAARARYRQGILRPERVEALERIGMIWSKVGAQRQQLVDHLREYRAKHGHADPPRGFVSPDGYRLGELLASARERASAGILPEDVKRELDALGVIWARTGDYWTEVIAHLRRFVAEHGHARVSQRHRSPDGFALGSAVRTTRAKRASLPEPVVAEFEALGMVWSVTAERWAYRLGLLRDFQAVHGHLRVPAAYHSPDGFSLGQLVTKLRRTKATLSAEIVAELNGLGMVWEPQAEKWAALLDHLRDFHRCHGHARVPVDFESPDGYTLGTRIGRIRRGTLCPPADIADQLTELGLDWGYRITRQPSQED
jgi:superfamily II DNA or RNA helicase